MSVRHWGIKSEDFYFKIPNFKLDKILNSAISYLKSVTKGSASEVELKDTYEKEEEFWKKMKDTLRDLEGETIKKNVEEIVKKMEEFPQEKLQNLQKRD